MSEPGPGVTGPGEPDERVLDGVIAEETGEEIIDSLRRLRQPGPVITGPLEPGEVLRIAAIAAANPRYRPDQLGPSRARGRITRR
jgi:hypothetical protein